MTRFWPGSAPRIVGKFRSTDTKLPVDVVEPVSVTVKDPTGSVFYDGPADRIDVGVYEVILPVVTAIGTWKFRVASSGTRAAVTEDVFAVQPGIV